ncbi:MAG TPA: hypothetical protein VMT85_08220 [Thermoanaerobaculia bacterium]|nr:hypothetical protein [Thermoanaerobaculia bacterium]
MPSTLVHLGTQAALSRVAWRHAPLLWAYLGGVLPDIPWILQRLIKTAYPAIDPAQLRLYVVAQASLLGCLVLAAAAAALAVRWRPVLALLCAGALLHLLLDAIEIKWANGVVLLAPFDWSQWQLGWFWSESVPGLAWTLAAAVWVAGHWREAAAEDPGVVLGRRRLLVAGALTALWLLLPLALMSGAWRGDVHDVRTLAEVAERSGRPVELYKADAYERPGPDVVETLEGEVLTIEGLEIREHQEVSIRGRFVDPKTVQVDEWFVHPDGWRDLGSYVGLALVALLWGRWAWRRFRQRRARSAPGAAS